MPSQPTISAATTSVRLSKSKYLSGLQCVKQLWLRVHEPDAVELIPDVALQALFDQGHEVSAKARERVPGGVLIEGDNLAARAEMTRRVIAAGARTLYEAVIEHEGTLIVADILLRGESGWTLIEVKSSTKVKPEHLPDVAVQLHVLRDAGIPVGRVELMHLNRECRYPDLSNLFVRQDLTTAAEQLLPEVAQNLVAYRAILTKPLPDIQPGPHCAKPYPCPFIGRCCPEPALHATETLHRPRRGQVDRLVRRGHTSLASVPIDDLKTDIQRRQQRAAVSESLIADPRLALQLGHLEHPIAFLDFETVMLAIPTWDGCRPYDQVPVQLSVHMELKNDTIKHSDWLADGPQDPREAIARQIIRLTADARTVLVYYQTFEEKRIRELQVAVPHLATDLASVVDRMVDLLPIVRDHVYDGAFRGSFSLKSVLPALVPDLSYQDLDIADGGAASATLKRVLFDGGMTPVERERAQTSLREYCRRDTFAMVRLLEYLGKLAESSSQRGTSDG